MKIEVKSLSRTYKVPVRVVCLHRNTRIEILEEDSWNPTQVLVCRDCDETILNLSDERLQEYEYED